MRRLLLIFVVLIGILLVIGTIVAPQDTWEIVKAVFETAQTADVKNTKEISGDHTYHKYPGNWVVETNDEDFDTNTYYNIDAPAQGSIMVFILDADMTPKEGVDMLIESMKKLVLRKKITQFNMWGPHKGYGVQMAGKITLFNGRIRGFGISNEKSTVVIIEIRFDEDEKMAKGGYDLIAETFKLKD